jgi:hypothetical protein
VAGDLIPPPSPAGRPGRAGSDSVRELNAGPAPEPPVALAEPDVASPEPSGPPPFRARFGFVFGALAGIAVCTAALAVTLVATSSDTGVELAENWSAWKPDSGDTFTAAVAIAEHVGGQYQRDNGDQLVQVNAGPIAIQGLPAGVAVRPQGEPIERLEGDGLLYDFDGLGDRGVLAGKPTQRRGSLLRREALELALYTFRYLEDITMVAVLLPPGKPLEDTQEVTRQAVFYRPGDLLAQLQVPLEQTLPPREVSPKTLSSEEAARIDQLTLKHLFVSQWRSDLGGLPYLVLREPSRIE